MTDLLDDIVLNGFKVDRSCYYNGKLRTEYRELQKRFPRVLNNSMQSLDEIATNNNLSENSLRDALLSHKTKAHRKNDLDDQAEFYYTSFECDVKSQLLDMLLNYYGNVVSFLNPCEYSHLLENITLEQLDIDLQSINPGV